MFQTVNKAAVAQHAPPELVGTVMGMSGECINRACGLDDILVETFVPVRGLSLKRLLCPINMPLASVSTLFLLSWRELIEMSAYFLLFVSIFYPLPSFPRSVLAVGKRKTAVVFFLLGCYGPLVTICQV